MIRAVTLAAIAAIALAAPAAAEISKTPEAEAKIRAMGARWDRDVLLETFKLYLPLLKAMPRDGVAFKRDVAYGPDERQRLDVFTPAAKPDTPVPVLLTLHGGGFTGGDKTDKENLYLDNVGLYFARRGIVAVNMTYRLAPKHAWPSGPEDIAAAVKWIRANIAGYGGDPGRIFLMGTSAGAIHVAAYAFHEQFHLAGGDGVAGAILLSGVYKPVAGDARMEAYYGKDPARHAERAPISHVAGRKIPVFVVFAEYDPLQMQQEALELYQALCKRDGHCPRLARLIGHNHLSVTTSINTADETVGREVLDFIKSGK